MNSLDCLLTAFKALRSNILRSVLTTLGIIIGVAAVISMVSVGSGANARVEQLINNLGSNLLLIRPGFSTSGGVRLGSGSSPTLTEQDAKAIAREVPGVLVAAPSVRGAGQVVSGNLNWSTAIYGVTPDYFTAREWKIDAGRAFNETENRSAAKVVLLGRTVAENLFPGGNPLGQKIRVKRVPFEVIGLLQAKGQSPMGTDQDDVVFIPLSTARKRVLGGRYLSGDTVGDITVKAADPDHVAPVEAKTRELLRQRHRLRKGEDDDFRLRNLAELLEARAESARTMSLLLAAVASVSLIVGGIGIMNIMLVSVTERTREIGLRRAIGARSRDILNQFLIEAITLSLIGGIIGVILGITGSLTVARLGDLPLIIEPESVLLAFSFSGAVGVFFGYYPARKAAGLDPIEALRYE